MAEITVSGMSMDEWLATKGTEGVGVVKEKETVREDNIEDYLDVSRLNGNYRIDYGESSKEILLINDNYLRDYIVTYLVKGRDISVYSKKRHRYEGYKNDDGLKRYNLGGKNKACYQILAESFLKKESNKTRVRVIDEDNKLGKRDIDNIEWYMADSADMKESVNLGDTLEELSKKGNKFIQVDEYVFIDNGSILSTHNNNYLTISSTRRNYLIKIGGEGVLVIPEAVVRIASEYTREGWSKLTSNQKLKEMRRRDFRGESKYVSKFSGEVKEELVRVPASSKQSNRRGTGGIALNDKINAIIKGLGSRRGVLTKSKKYILVENGAVISVRTGKELSKVGKGEDMRYAIYLGKKQVYIYQKSIYHFLKEYDTNVIEDNLLKGVVGKNNKYYRGES